MVEDEDTIHLADRRQAMRNDQGRAVREQLLNTCLDQGFGLASTLEVASSRIRIAGLYASARVSDSNCFSPSERFAPRSNIGVSSPSARLSMRRSVPIILAACSKVSRVMRAITQGQIMLQ